MAIKTDCGRSASCGGAYSDGDCDFADCPQLVVYESYCIRAKATERQDGAREHTADEHAWWTVLATRELEGQWYHAGFPDEEKWESFTWEPVHYSTAVFRPIDDMAALFYGPAEEHSTLGKYNPETGTFSAHRASLARFMQWSKPLLDLVAKCADPKPCAGCDATLRRKGFPV